MRRACPCSHSHRSHSPALAHTHTPHTHLPLLTLTPTRPAAHPATHPPPHTLPLPHMHAHACMHEARLASSSEYGRFWLPGLDPAAARAAPTKLPGPHTGVAAGWSQLGACGWSACACACAYTCARAWAAPG
eukprot:2437-Chlamydomonas_euryale.AAC.1